MSHGSPKMAEMWSGLEGICTPSAGDDTVPLMTL